VDTSISSGYDILGACIAAFNDHIAQNDFKEAFTFEVVNGSGLKLAFIGFLSMETKYLSFAVTGMKNAAQEIQEQEQLNNLDNGNDAVA